MTISPTVQQIVEILRQYTESSLKNPDRLAAVLQHAYDSGRAPQLGDLAFSAKYLWKLYLTLEKQPPDGELLEKLQTELSNTVGEFRERLQVFASAQVEGDGSDFTSTVDDCYLSVQPSSLTHLLELAHDLGWMKNWELDMSREETAAPTAGEGSA